MTPKCYQFQEIHVGHTTIPEGKSIDCILRTVWVASGTRASPSAPGQLMGAQGYTAVTSLLQEAELGCLHDPHGVG